MSRETAFQFLLDAARYARAMGEDEADYVVATAVEVWLLTGRWGYIKFAKSYNRS